MLKRILHKLFVPAIIPMLALASPAAVYADEEAIALLNRMNHAVHTLNYSGTLAYVKNDTLSSLHINHNVVNGVETERVVRLNEEGNEISRESQDFSLGFMPTIRPEMKKVYSFDIGRENRIANIPCTIITARPKDRERYLQKYCIDAVTGMLLDYILVGKSHKPVEQFMFTSIEIRVPEGTPTEKTTAKLSLNNGQTACPNETCASGAKAIKVDGVVATAIVDQAVSSKNKTTIVEPRTVKILRQVLSADLDDGWVMETLPVGFEMSQAPSSKIDTDGSSGETKHYIISDGLSSLSVFVAPFADESDIGAVKINSGALNVVSQRKGDSVITVVGEVPENTLRNIVDNLRKKSN